MIVLIRTGPDDVRSAAALKLARERAADVALMDEAVWMARPDGLGGFCGTAYAVAEHIQERGIMHVERGVRVIDLAQMVLMLAEEDTVVML